MTTSAARKAANNPSPVIVSTSVAGAANAISCQRDLSVPKDFDPIRLVPPNTATFMLLSSISGRSPAWRSMGGVCSEFAWNPLPKPWISVALGLDIYAGSDAAAVACLSEFQPAVDGDHLAGEPVRIRIGEQDDPAGNFLRIPASLERYALALLRFNSRRLFR